AGWLDEKASVIPTSAATLLIPRSAASSSVIPRSAETTLVIPGNATPLVIPRSAATRNLLPAVRVGGSRSLASLGMTLRERLGMTLQATGMTPGERVGVASSVMLRGRKPSRLPAKASMLFPLAACREHGRPDPDIRMAISHDREEIAGASTTPTVPDRLEVPPDVLQTYSGIRLRWKDSTKNKEGTVEVPLDGTAKIP